MKAATAYYVIEAIMPWSTIAIGGMRLGKDESGACGYCAVFDDPHKADQFAKELGVEVRIVFGAELPKGGAQ